VRLFSTLQRGLVELPDPPGPIGMYVCGPTVYARAHIGNARPFVIASWYARWLRRRGYDVTLVHNITDVNDKIYEAAPGASAARAAEATAWYLEDVARFGLDEVDHFPKVTETMDVIIRFIAELVDAGAAYEVDGDVYFRVSRQADYGRLSGQRPDQVEEQEPNARKEDPRDFALWKANKEDEDTWWDSPWGRGRPGWHIECSAMAEQLLGPAFEIHGGGLDLVFPHHENELAQSAALGHEFARIWMHNGMLRFTGEKMSKSVGNVATIQEAFEEWGREALLVFFLTAHWRSPIDYSEETLTAAAARAEGFREVFRNPSHAAAPGAWERFEQALDDDFATPVALALMHEWRDHELLRRALDVFGLGSLAEATDAPAELHELARRRQEARAARDFATADRLRAELETAGWDVRDDPGGYRLVPRP
jgi:cysteinyl-tRNA synthetase